MIDPTTGVDDGTGPSPNPISGLLGNGILSPTLSPNYATPEQRKQMYAYANALMAPQPVQHWAQGLGEIVRSLVGGTLSHQADVQEQAAAGQSKSDIGSTVGQYLSPPISPASGASASQASAPPAAAPALANYLTSQGLPPAAAAGLVGNFAAESNLNPNASRPGDGSDGSQSRGLGQWNGQRAQNLNAYAAKYGLNPSDPKTQADFSLNELGVKGNKGDPGYGSQASSGRALMAAQTPQDAATAALGYERPQGYSAAHPENSLGYAKRITMAQALMGPSGVPQGQPMAFAPQQPPMGSAPMPGSPQAPMAPRAPMQMAQNGGGNGLPVSAQALGAMLGNPNVPDAIKHQTMEMMRPTVMSDANGNQFFSRQSQAPQGGPAFVGGRAIQQGTDSVPGVTSGPINAPQTTIAPPTVAGAPPMAGGGMPSNTSTPPGAPGQPNSASWMAPGSVMGDMKAQQQANEARGQGMTAIAGKDADEYKQAQADSATSRAALYPLRQMQGLLESGKLPATGHLAPNELDLRSVANMFGVGNPDTLASMEEFRKQSGLAAVRMAQQIGAAPTDFALSASQGTVPGNTLSEKGNNSLNDNLIRLTQVSQKQADAKQDWYQSHNNSMAGFQQNFANSIDGANAIPLSKYPIISKVGTDGNTYDKVPSTDKRGFSWVKHGTVQ